MKKNVLKSILLGSAILIILVLIISELLTRRFWFGDYKIYINEDLKNVSIFDYRGGEYVEIPTNIGPFNVDYISYHTFEGNETVSSIYIPSDIDSEVSITIYNCPNLKRIEFAEGIKIISMDVFECNNLTELIIPEGVELINGCFHCESLEEVSFPDTLKATGAYYFAGTKFKELHKNDKYYMVGDGVLLFFNGDYDQDIAIPQGTKCFDNYIDPDDSLPQRNIYIPETITTLNTQVYDNDTFFFGNGEIENLDLDSVDKGVKGTIVAPANSYMEQYCKENGYNFRAMTEEEEKEWREKTEAAASEITYQE